MKGKWSVTRNLIGGAQKYAVYRLRHKNKIDHSGNREYATRYIDDRLICERVAEYLNGDPNGGVYNAEGLTLEQRQHMTEIIHDCHAVGGIMYEH